MNFRVASLQICRGVSAVALASLLSMQAGVVFAAAPVGAGSGYEIPISDLKTVKKKSPPKRVKKEAQKKKTANGEHKKSSSEITATPKTTAQAIESNNASPDEPASQKPSLATEVLPETGNTKILHSPYNFVAAGKRTVISAVIDSPTDIQEVSCSVRTGNGTERTQVKMVKANGTQFTYTATLPALSPKTHELNYIISVIDSQGKVTRSREFVTLVKSLLFVPGWQVEDSDRTRPESSQNR